MYCFNRKMVCTVDLMPVSNWKPWVGKSEPRLQKRSQVEVDLDSESGEDSQKLEESAVSALVGIWEALEDHNELQREQNVYLRRIMQALEGGDIITREQVGSTLK